MDKPMIAGKCYTEPTDQIDFDGLLKELKKGLCRTPTRWPTSSSPLSKVFQGSKSDIDSRLFFSFKEIAMIERDAQ
jgi:hypothetical protein